MAARRSRLRRLALGLGLALVLVTGVGYVGVRSYSPALLAEGPTEVAGTRASAVFSIAGREIRQVRYRDRGVLDYTFRLTNPGALPVTVRLARDQDEPRLFGFVALEDDAGARRLTVPGNGTRRVHLLLRMGGCESLSARAGSFATAVQVSTEQLGMDTGTVRVRLPEEIHTGSPREAFCPSSTAESRPPG